MVIEGGERDPQGQRLLIRAFGRGDSHDVTELPVGEEAADLGDHESGGGAGPEAEDHAAADVLDGLDGSELLEVVLGEGDGGGERSDRRHGVTAAMVGERAAAEERRRGRKEGGGGGGGHGGGTIGGRERRDLLGRFGGLNWGRHRVVIYLLVFFFFFLTETARAGSRKYF